MSINSTAAAEKSRLVCTLLAGVAETNPVHASYIRERIAEIQNQQVLPTQYVDIVRQINQMLLQDRNAWNTRLRIAFDGISSLASSVQNQRHLPPEITRKAQNLSTTDDPLLALDAFTSLTKTLVNETVSLRQKDHQIVSKHAKKDASNTHVIANDISSTSKRMLALASPLIQALQKEHPGNGEVEGLVKRLKELSNASQVDFFESVLLVEDTSKQIQYLLAQRISAESRFLSGIHEHLHEMHQNLNNVLESSGVLGRASAKERDRLEQLMKAFKTAADHEENPVVLKQIISENIDAMQTAVNTIIEKQSISHRQQERIIQQLMTDVETQRRDIKTMQQTHQTLAKAAQQAEEASYRDQLTGAFNRRAYDLHSGKLTAYAAKGAEISLIVLDIDRFKSINDNCGHTTGDKVLRTVLTIILNTLESDELAQRIGIRDINKRCKVFRVGGEEFVLTCAGIPLHQACLIADHLRAVIASRPMRWTEKNNENNEINERKLLVTASFGVSAFNRIDKESDSVFIMADKAMYQAKKEGRNQTWFYLGTSLEKFQK